MCGEGRASIPENNVSAEYIPHAMNMAAGLRKHKKYNWKETNLAFFGSDLEKKV